MKVSSISAVLALWFLAGTVCHAQVPARQEFFFPQVVDGPIAATTNFNTIVTLTNPNPATATGTLEVFASDGSPLTITFEDLFGNTISLPSINFTIAANGIFQLKTIGTQQQLVVGYAKVTANVPIGGTLVFVTKDTVTGEIKSQAGIEPSGVVQGFSVIDYRGESSTGLAIVNSENNETQITLTEYDPSGNQLEQVSFSLGPFEHQAFFFFERLANVGQGFQVGLVTVVSSNTKVAAVAVKWDPMAGGEDKFTVTPVLQTN